MKGTLSTSLIFSLILVLISCQEKRQAQTEISEEFEKILDAHGDWQKWLDAEAMSYSMIHETTLTQEEYLINLKRRKIRISGFKFEIGNDGEQTWISPNREAYEGNSVRFYHNLYFYFLNIPYIFTDPGVTVEKVEDKMVNGKSYPTYQAKFEPNVGDSPEDQYFMLVNPETNRLEYLLYTVTYFGNSEPVLNALKYEDYRDVDGLVFPRYLTGYNYENDSTQNMRYQVTFVDVMLLEEKFDDSIFEKPDQGVYAD